MWYHTNMRGFCEDLTVFYKLFTMMVKCFTPKNPKLCKKCGWALMTAIKTVWDGKFFTSWFHTFQWCCWNAAWYQWVRLKVFYLNVTGLLMKPCCLYMQWQLLIVSGGGLTNWMTTISMYYNQWWHLRNSKLPKINKLPECRMYLINRWCHSH